MEIRQKNKKIKKEIVKARAVGKDLKISTKQAIAICSFIKNKNPTQAKNLLEQVIKKKLAVPMKGQIAHKKNLQKLPSGRYPIKTSKEFIKLLNNLIANSTAKGLDAESLLINAKADKAPRPVKPTRMAYGRKRFKRTHVTLEAIQKLK